MPQAPRQPRQPRRVSSAAPPPRRLHVDSQRRNDQDPLIPTAEQQELYNRWKDAEKQQTFSEQLELRDGGGAAPGVPGLLTLPSVSATSMSRSTSRTSTYSITYGIDSAEVLNHRESRHRTRKAHRSGPLDKVVKARAAFMRKLAASCSNCRARRVKCSHVDLRLFDAAYSARQSGGLPLDQGQPSSSVVLSSPPPAVAPSAYQATTQDLLGITMHPDPEQVGHRYGSYPHEVTLESTLEPALESALDAVDTLPASHPDNMHDRLASWQAQPHVITPLSSEAPPSYLVATDTAPFLPPTQGRHVLICSEQLFGGWQCGWGELETSPVTLADSSRGCRRQFFNLEETMNHFSMSHAPFCAAEPPFMFKCLSCGFLNVETPPCTCPHCDNRHETEWEKRYYGYVADQEIQPFYSEVRTTAEDGSPYAPLMGYPGSSYRMTPFGLDHGSYWSGSNDGGTGSSADRLWTYTSLELRACLSIAALRLHSPPTFTWASCKRAFPLSQLATYDIASVVADSLLVVLLFALDLTALGRDPSHGDVAPTAGITVYEFLETVASLCWLVAPALGALVSLASQWPYRVSALRLGWPIPPDVM